MHDQISTWMGKDSREMDTGNIIIFNLTLLVALISPGPALLYALRTTLANGRTAGIATGCGLAFMAAGWTLMALLGLDGLFKLFPLAYLAFKFIGAAYLIYLAWRTWINARTPVEDSTRHYSRAFLGGVLINMANPKAVLFAAAVLIVVFPPELSAMDKAFIVANHMIVEIIAYIGFAVLLSTRTVANRYLAIKPVLDRIAALVLGGLGVRLLVDE